MGEADGNGVSALRSTTMISAMKMPNVNWKGGKVSCINLPHTAV